MQSVGVDSANARPIELAAAVPAAAAPLTQAWPPHFTPDCYEWFADSLEVCSKYLKPRFQKTDDGDRREYRDDHAGGLFQNEEKVPAKQGRAITTAWRRYVKANPKS